jgi:hypothetical protein
LGNKSGKKCILEIRVGRKIFRKSGWEENDSENQYVKKNILGIVVGRKIF